jgi:hypothetical protein
MKRKTLLLTVLIIAVYVAHQDSWNWKRFEPLVFGFLPIGLAYQAFYSFLAAALMAILVKVAWPRHLENVESKDAGRPSDEKKEGH